MPSTHRVVVDGSNLATEGRTVPSLAQLDEAVRAYLLEDPEADIVVVVDASFSHRIDPAERAQLEAAELHGELVAPPAGAIGRGDAFVLRIAERTGAIVLSNDSFQEFHEEHPWLFDDGRLVGGKPVPGVGWIFTPRRPVRGARSRKARDTELADGDGEELSAPRKAAEVAKALKEATKAASGTRVKAAAKAADAKGAKKKGAKDDARAGSPKKAVATQPSKSGKAELKAERVKRVKAVPAKAAAKAKDQAKDQKDSPGSKRARRAEKAVGTAAAGPKPKETAKQVRATKAAKASAAIKAAKSSKVTKAAKKAPGGSRPVGIRAAIDSATQEVLEPTKHSAELAASAKPKRRRRAEPPPAVNEPLAFINFVAAHPLGSVVEGVVGSFTSHGAMVEAPMPDGGVLHCYAPLIGLGSPPPRAAREVLKRGERRGFTLVGLDPPRRMAELALPEFAPAFLGAKAQGPQAAG